MTTFSKEEYFNHTREDIRGLYFGFPQEDLRADLFRKMSAIMKAKAIVDNLDNLYTDCLIRELPVDLYAELVKSVTFIKGEITGGRCPEKHLKNMEPCVEIGETIMSSVTVTELSEDEKAAITTSESMPLTLPERMIDKEEEYKTKRNFITFRNASMHSSEKGEPLLDTDLTRWLRRMDSIHIAMFTISNIVHLKEEYGIEELPSDIYIDLKNNVDYLKEEYAGGKHSEGEMHDMRQSIAEGEDYLTSAVVFETAEGSKYIDYVDLGEAFKKKGWKEYHQFMAGNRWVKGGDTVTCYLGKYRLNGQPVGKEYLCRILGIDTSRRIYQVCVAVAPQSIHSFYGKAFHEGVIWADSTLPGERYDPVGFVHLDFSAILEAFEKDGWNHSRGLAYELWEKGNDKVNCVKGMFHMNGQPVDREYICQMLNIDPRIMQVAKAIAPRPLNGKYGQAFLDGVRWADAHPAKK